MQGVLRVVGWLIHDLGRPERFLHMLQVIKVTSPLSVGSYILAPFSAAAGAAAAVELLGWFPRLKQFGGAVAALFGAPLATYTAVLLSNTAVPVAGAPVDQGADRRTAASVGMMVSYLMGVRRPRAS